MNTYDVQDDPMTTTAPTSERQPRYDDNLIIEKHRGDEYWFAVWYDHAQRLIKRRLTKVSIRTEDDRLALARKIIEARNIDMDEYEVARWYRSSSVAGREIAEELARFEYERYVADVEIKLKIRAESTPQEICEFTQIANFPRAVVARHIKHICDKISRWEMADESRNGQPGLQLFAERAGISSREVHRLIDDEERISVGSDTVDKICVQFDLLFDDFIDESLEWAERRGRWENRPGTDDPWPIGYYSIPKIEEDLI